MIWLGSGSRQPLVVEGGGEDDADGGITAELAGDCHVISGG